MPCLLIRAFALSVFLPMAAMADSDAKSVIRQQFEAFGAGDVPRAFEFASPQIQGMFGTPGNFGLMVEQGYPMVWNHSALRFGGSRTKGDDTIQTVLVTGVDNAIYVLEYTMVLTADGWRINGVRVVPPAGLGA
ncbi:DUF4864 domain-containing protein [Pseudoprimorskyibacter insulae]|uniref:DUF4864 domain-containing protein n=1 Tax=Pseudoprimorskyibacter insulae TaxID=1695997 RepID=A0A2R8AQF2_9RHOB|nr:DUF4864 domain-containing protein [Pseudoprimorskyibacter insulae]SPF78245.1 hypothetical protein PRI8871_00838 [Pseudoprimorskyibacter insulae]